jgi:hypothetical protein
MIRKPVFTVLQCSGLGVAAGGDVRSVLLMMKANEPLGRAERETRLPLGNESNGMRIPQKVETDFPEPELRDEEAWEDERRTQRWHKFKTP